MESASDDIPRRLPRGSHGLDRDVVEASQRTRLLEAVGRAVAERGYAAATIDDVVRRAGVSKKTFYDHFADKQDCFLAAYESSRSLSSFLPSDSLPSAFEIMSTCCVVEVR